MDYVECKNSTCDFIGIVLQDDEICPKCKGVGTLIWTYSKCCNVSFKYKNEKKYCSKCKREIKC